MKKNFLFLLLLIDPAYACGCGPSFVEVINMIATLSLWHVIPIIVISRLFEPGNRLYWIIASILLIPVSWVIVDYAVDYIGRGFTVILVSQFVVQFSFLYIAWRKSKELKARGTNSVAA